MKILEIIDQKIEADVFRFYNEKEQWLAFVGKINNLPVVICSCPSNDFPFIRPELNSCYIIVSKDELNIPIYNIEINNNNAENIFIKNVTRTNSIEFRNYTILINAMLINKMPLVEIVEAIYQINNIENGINTFQAAIYRFLKMYLVGNIEIIRTPV